MDWRPIAEAPKDGTRVLSWDGETMAVIAWSTRDDEWFLDDARDRPDWEATHFMPLPAPPKDGEG